MEETERDCLLFAFYATVGEVIEQTADGSAFTTLHLNDLTENLNNILCHGCSVQVTQDTVDYWPFIEGLQTLQPCLQGIFDKFSRKRFESNNDRCLAWIRYSLQEQALQSHLAILVANQDHVKRNYYDHAFLKSRHHMSALRDCLRALNQRSMELLPDLADFTNIGVSHFSPGSLPSPTDSPQVALYNDYDSGVECVQAETGVVPNVVNINQQRTLEFRRTNESLAVAPSLAVANFERKKSSSFHGMSSLDQERRLWGVSGAQRLLQKLQHEERRPRSLTSTPELQESLLSCVSDNDGEPRDLSRGEDDTRVQSPGSGISVRSDDSFVLITAQPADLSIRRTDSKDRIDGMSEDDLETDIFPDPPSQQDETVVRRVKQEDRRKEQAPPTANRVSLLEAMGSPRLFAADNLEKDNAHFALADTLIAAIEEVNSIQSESRHFSVSVDEVRQYVRLRSRHRSASISSLSDEPDRTERKNDSEDEEFELSGSWNDIEEEVSEASEMKDHMSSSMASLFATSDFVANHRLPKSLSSRRNSIGGDNLTASAIGSSLVDLFSPELLPPQSRLSQIVAKKDKDKTKALLLPVVQAPTSITSKEERNGWTDPSRVRGNHEWAPPRAQIIFNIHPPLKRRVIIERQNYRCAGCGLKINSQHIKFFRYCEYMGRFFCSSCHGNSVHVIPGRILHKWDFKQYPVSNFAYELLSGLLYDPLFNIANINRPIIHKVKDVKVAAALRRQLYYLKDFIRVCRLADSLSPDFEQRGYLISDSEWTVYSLHDLVLLHQGDLIRPMKDLLHRGLKHVDGCQLCQARGFVCEVCRVGVDVIFPFQITKCVQCPRCRNCFHRLCFDKIQGLCPRCARLRARKKPTALPT